VKIAIVEWWPRLCGAVNWAVHLSGAQTEHQVDLLTFSKSGKLLMPWTKVPGNWKVHKVSDALNVLNSYDLVILSDIVCRAPEVKPKVEGEEPYYVKIVRQLTTKWTTMIHDGSYAGKESNTMIKLLTTSSFSGKLITTRYPEAKTRIDKLFESDVLDYSNYKNRITWLVDPYLPYDFRKANGVIPPLEQRSSEIMHIGRLSTNKGQDALLDLFKDLNTNVHQWGYCAYGKPSHGWLLWELATEHLGYAQVKFPITTKPQLTNPNIHKFYTGAWSVGIDVPKDDSALYGARTWNYRGGFRDFNEIDWTPIIALGLTNEGWKGTLEYATLDAIAHGCVGVVPAQQIEYAQYDSLITVPYQRCSYKIKKGEPVSGRRDWDRDAILCTLNDLSAMPLKELACIADNQREEIIRKHSCERILNTIVESHRV
jgi:glycosyltransferase involved in cell wall biosynthesis